MRHVSCPNRLNGLPEHRFELQRSCPSWGHGRPLHPSCGRFALPANSKLALNGRPGDHLAWNNTLSVAQQSIIMRKHGAKIELFDNIKALFGKKKTQT
jgi:hypothetical protein